MNAIEKIVLTAAQNSPFEKVAGTFAQIATLVFLGMMFATFSGIYGWLHPMLWAVQLLSFMVLEGAFYFIRGSRPKPDMAIALAMWTSLGVWVSIEHFTVVVSAIVVLRCLPEGALLRVAAVLLAAGVGSLVTFADINPWSSAPGKPWLHHLFLASCCLNMVLLLARAAISVRETKTP